MLKALLWIIGAPIGLLLAWFLLLVLIDNLGPVILTMVLLFKWTLSTIAELIRCVFRTKGNSSPA